jgi:hypothetical protein
MYKYITQDDDSCGIIQVNEDSRSWIVPDANHYLWKEYLEWKAQGNTPEPADEV